MSAPWFRTTDMLRWGPSNSGGNLSATQFDENTWWAYEQITALQARPIPSEIAYFVLTGDQLTVVMTDHTTRGPYTIPTSAFRFRGDWLPDTVYLVNDVFTINGNTYIVLVDHTSASTFNAGANDGLGHDYYGLMLSNPGNSLPTGGAVGQFLIKTTTTDFAVSWAWPLPVGGTTDQVLMKNSNTNQDASWRTSPWVWAPPASPPASSGQFLKTVDGSSTNTEWATISSGGISAPPVSPPAFPGYLLATADGTTTNMEWVDPSSLGPSSLPWSSLTGTPTPAQFRSVLQATNIGTNISGSVNWDIRADFIFVVTPNGDLTINVPDADRVFTRISLIIYDFNAGPQTISFGTNFRLGTANLVMTAGSKVYLMEFICDGTTIFELTRTGPL